METLLALIISVVLGVLGGIVVIRLIYFTNFFQPSNYRHDLYFGRRR